MTCNDNANIVKKPISEDFVNNNRENERDAKKWFFNPLRVSGNLFQDRRLSDTDQSAKVEMFEINPSRPVIGQFPPIERTH